MLRVWWVWSHHHGLSTQDTCFRNPSKTSPTKTSQKPPYQIKFKAHCEDRDKQSRSRSHSHCYRDLSSSHHDLYRGCSRSWPRDNCSQPRSSSHCSCSTYRDYSHQSHHDTPHLPRHRSSTHRSSSAYHSSDHSRSYSHPSYKSSRWDSHRSHSHSSKSWGKPHIKENWRVKIEDPHTDYYSCDEHSSDLGEEADHLN